MPKRARAGSALAERIAQVRASLGLNQAELARELKISPATMMRYEKGARAPDVETVIRLCQVSRVSPLWLLGLEPGSEIVGKHDEEVLRLRRILDGADRIVVKGVRAVLRAAEERELDGLKLAAEVMRDIFCDKPAELAILESHLRAIEQLRPALDVPLVARSGKGGAA